MKKDKKHLEPEVVKPDGEAEDTMPDEAQDGTGEETQETQALLDEKQKQYDELLDKYQRLMAEFDNFRKRSIKEKASMYDEGVKSVLAKLLPVADNFERAMAVTEGKEAAPQADDNFYKGVDMIFRQFHGLFEELGLEVIPALNEKFDHNFHFAVAHVEDENYGENEIIDEMQKGYKYKDKVIRASMVRVAN